MGRKQPPIEPTLEELARQTPTRPMHPADEELSSFLASLPPPPMLEERKQEFVEKRVRQQLKSGSWEFDDLWEGQRTFYVGAMHAAKRDWEARADKARADKAEAELAETRKFWRIVAAGVLVGCIVGAIGWIAVELIRHSAG